MSDSIPQKFTSRVRDALERSPGARVFLLPIRAKLAISYLTPTMARMFKWLFMSRELDNFTYQLTVKGERYMAHSLALALGSTPEVMQVYFDELKLDTELRRWIIDLSRNGERRRTADPRADFGRRIGWYAVVRHMRPHVVVETGVEKGLGAILLCAALKRNVDEGFPGRYYGTDIYRGAGYLLNNSPYKEFGKVLYGDSIQSLEALNEMIDVFINDSDHSHIYEFNEYRTVAGKLSNPGIILSDNAHVSDSLLRFAEETGRNFLFVREEPLNHWYAGAGIGIAFKPRMGDNAESDNRNSAPKR